MRFLSSVIIIFLAIAGSLAAAPPTLGYIYNNFSNIPPGLPGYGIPQGSLFVLYGANTGPATAVQAFTYPLPTTAPGLGGTSVSVTVNGTTLAAPMVATTSGQVAAILPSATPTGTGTVTLTYNGAASNALPITVVPSAFGIATFNQQGSGEAVVTYGSYTPVTATNSTKPGDTLILWGSGLGAGTGSDALPPKQVDLGTPVQVLVGNVPATIIYRGRSAYPSIDQINFTIPAGVSGCNVSLIVQTTTSSGPVLSNSTTIPIAPNGGTCSDTNAAFSQAQLTTFAGKSSVNIGYVQLKQSNSGILTNGQFFVSSTVKAQAQFVQLTPPQIPSLAAAFFTPSIGSCVTTITTGANAGQGAGITGTTNPLDAGTFLTLTPPSGAPQMLGADSSKLYAGLLPAVVAGAYKISGTGGTNISAFNASFTVPQQVTWTNETSLGPIVGTNTFGPTINRNQPLTITWTGGDANGFVGIVIDGGFTGVALPVDVSATCTAPASAGSFTIPTSVLLIFPNTQSLSGYGAITVGSASNAQLIAVPGTDATLVSSQTSGNIEVIFQ